jgi:hypothetical protein
MTVQEASKTCFGKPYVVDVEEHEEAIKTIKEALKEVEQYRALGTVEELKEAREKQVAKKPIKKEFELGTYYQCPICGDITLRDYCGKCGQKLDWSEEYD